MLRQEGRELLAEMAAAIQATPNLPNLLHDDDLSERVM